MIVENTATRLFSKSKIFLFTPFVLNDNFDRVSPLAALSLLDKTGETFNDLDNFKPLGAKLCIRPNYGLSFNLNIEPTVLLALSVGFI